MNTIRPEPIANYLSEIDTCLKHRAIALSEQMKEVSLKEIVDKANEAKQQQRQAEEQQASLNQRMLESKL